jgi:hypothetical protein
LLLLSLLFGMRRGFYLILLRHARCKDGAAASCDLLPNPGYPRSQTGPATTQNNKIPTATFAKGPAVVEGKQGLGARRSNGKTKRPKEPEELDATEMKGLFLNDNNTAKEHFTALTADPAMYKVVVTLLMRTGVELSAGTKARVLVAALARPETRDVGVHLLIEEREKFSVID